MIILIDNGHGIDTLGKCSPDKSYYEWRWCREMAAMIQAELQRRGYDARLLVPEQRDIDLKERVRRANQVCVEHGSGNVILLSIHSNASGNGEWKSARGWSAYTTRGLTNSDRLATSLYNAAERYLYGQRIRADYSDGAPVGKPTSILSGVPYALRFLPRIFSTTTATISLISKATKARSLSC